MNMKLQTHFTANKKHITNQYKYEIMSESGLKSEHELAKENRIKNTRAREKDR